MYCSQLALSLQLKKNVAMDLLIDANILLAVILNEPEKERIVELTAEAKIVAPEMIPYEIGNALSAMMKRHRLTQEQVQITFKIFEAIPIRLEQVNIADALGLSHRFCIYAYDAYYLEVARRLHIPLLTLDRQMKNIGHSLKIELLEV